MFCILQNYNAKISDFGLAKLGPSGGQSHVTTRVMGTYGYAAPEYIATGNYIWFIWFEEVLLFLFHIFTSNYLNDTWLVDFKET